MRSIAIYGGTFDPIHNGHIQTSITIQNYFNFDHYYFLPCKSPAIKPPTSADGDDRVKMLQLGLKEFKNFTIDLREMNRDSPSYMSDTLQSFREEYNTSSLTLILGYDAFISLPQWHHWEKIITLANLLVMERNKYTNSPLPESLKKLLAEHQTNNKSDLITNKSGKIYLFNAGHYEVSSTLIRSLLKKGHAAQNEVPKTVLEYIKKKGLYQ
ncbi:MAG TPA: nicotinate-nucleotide adenylyltransferase [Legionella sp.]|nr:nicotinate-nucleotide adenylyltransferase [Legionella sp.]